MRVIAAFVLAVLVAVGAFTAIGWIGGHLVAGIPVDSGFFLFTSDWTFYLVTGVFFVTLVALLVALPVLVWLRQRDERRLRAYGFVGACIGFIPVCALLFAFQKNLETLGFVLATAVQAGLAGSIATSLFWLVGVRGNKKF